MLWTENFLTKNGFESVAKRSSFDWAIVCR